ncbi:hypothetical protein KUTeg_013895 [Tegillarca granosa]|uniref:Uncharacterized protein n=1 Tax=Tegillarca granosa TaxID=220873 RepID=A0ABQ9EV03_TEGGR|nr:hypothetical protein KUTeg_013895 [Tegillarca granosa]
MLAQFFATNYALYTSATSQGRRGMFYPPMACHPSHIPFLNPQAASAFRFASRIQNLPIQNNSQLRTETQREHPETNRDGVKFSIDNILNDNNKKEEREESSKDDGEDEECMIEEDDEDEDSNKFSWLQCTRYKPPKLPSK